jgi:hypothetical protein
MPPVSAKIQVYIGAADGNLLEEWEAGIILVKSPLATLIPE